MSSKRQCTLYALLCLLLGGWLSEGAIMQQGLRAGSSMHGSKSVDVDSDSTDKVETGDEDGDDDGDSDNNEDGDDDDNKDTPVVYESKVRASLAQMAAVPSAAPAASLPMGIMAPSPALPLPLSSQQLQEQRASMQLLQAEAALSANRNKQNALRERLEHLSNESASTEEIDAYGKRVSNETDSVAMGSMLSNVWKEMRMFELPLYAEHIEEELAKLKKEELALQGKVAKAEDELAAIRNAIKGNASQTKNATDNETESDSGNLTGSGAWTKFSEAAQEMNFWGKTGSEKVEQLVHTLVYIVAGISLAVLHFKARARYPKVFAVEPRSDVVRGSRDYFTFSLFGCFGAPNTCVMGCCCPCLQWADTLDRHGYLPYWQAFGAFFVLMVLEGFTWGISGLVIVALGVFYRQKLRGTYELDNGTWRTIGLDILAWFFCGPCSIVQEAREESVAPQDDPDLEQ